MPPLTKVYASSLAVFDVDGYGQRRVIVTAPNQKRAAELFGCSLNHVRLHAEVTKDRTEIAIADAVPGTVFARCEGVDASKRVAWFRRVTLDGGRRYVKDAFDG